MPRRSAEEPEGLLADDPEADPVSVAREVVLRLLTTRARSRAELQDALRRRAVPPEAADEVLARFAELGLVDDASFAQAWVEGQQRRLRSSRILRQELVAKGVERAAIDEALEGLGEDADHQAARAFAEKRLRSMGGLEPEVRYRRLAGALARRGFPPGVCRRVLAEVLGRAPAEEDAEASG